MLTVEFRFKREREWTVDTTQEEGRSRPDQSLDVKVSNGNAAVQHTVQSDWSLLAAALRLMVAVTIIGLSALS